MELISYFLTTSVLSKESVDANSEEIAKLQFAF